MRGLKLFGAVIALGISGLTQAATALPYSRVIVFGDSLVDAGNAQAFSPLVPRADPAPKAAGYYQGETVATAGGRFSNGQNFADYLSKDITGVETTSYARGGLNFAVGGVRTDQPAPQRPPNLPPLPRSDFQGQLDIFGSLKQPIDSNALVLVTFGGNDVRDTRSTPGSVGFDTSTAALTAGIDRLLGFGARTIVVTGLADIGEIPESQSLAAGGATPAELTARSMALNTLFRNVVMAADTGNSANIQFFDLFDFATRALSDPTSVGLPANLDTTSICLGNIGCEDNLFFDPIHPTTIAHRAIANGIAAQLAAVPEPQTWVLLILGVGMVGANLRRRRDGEELPLAA